MLKQGRFSSICLALAGSIVVVNIALADQARLPDSSIIETTYGPVQGFHDQGIVEFLGIPYAAPPVGNLRWMPPKPHAPWTQVLKATAFGSNCPQNQNHVFAGPVNLTDEDCLFVNVFTPTSGNPQQKLPVIFFIYGGGNIEGESTDYDGSKLALGGPVVVVTFNYRIGTLGFLAVPALDQEGHLFGNYAILDQQLALQWVRDNIAKFGGDPDNVTIGGQSAGSFNVEANLVSPLSAGLFHRAILESLVTETQNLAAAEAAGTAAANTLGCGAANGITTNQQITACLRGLSVEQITVGPVLGSLIGDGAILPVQPATVSPTQPGGIFLAFQDGRYNRVPIMSGNVEDEGNFGLALTEYNAQRVTTPGVPFVPGGTETPFSAAQYAAAIAGFAMTPTSATGGLSAREFVATHYPLTSSVPPGPQLVDDRLSSDQSECAQHRINRVLASGPNPTTVYAYEFRDQSAPFYFPPLIDFVSLAYHTADLQYLFPHFHGGPIPPSVAVSLNDNQEKLSDQLVKAWTNFARTGDPSGRGVVWPRYQGSNRGSVYLLENIEPIGLTLESDLQFTASHNCDFWDSVQTP